MATCRECKRDEPETAFAYDKKAHARKKTCMSCLARRAPRVLSGTPMKDSLGRRCKNHGITVERFTAMLTEQHGRCPGCDADISVPRNAYIDHDHACCIGRFSCGACVRGLLCISCNSGTAMFKDDPEIFARMLTYLRR